MSYHTFNHILFHTDSNGITILTINRPDKLNALNAELLNELDRSFDLVEENDSIHVVIITGSGEKAFVAGADIKELSTLNQDTGEELSLRGQHIFNRIERCSKPVIALVNGYALGGGAELAMACHIRIATENAAIGMPEASLGLIPGYGGTQRLPQLAGKAKAMEMILTGQQLKADEALKIGLFNHVLPVDEVLDFTKKIALKMMKNGPLALAAAIRAMNASFNKDGYAHEAEEFGNLCSTYDFKEGTSAFLEKRKAEFAGK
jgi:enoyl-CoA hydratase